MLIITQYIAKHELKALDRYFSIEDILEGGRKVLKKLGTEIKPPKKITDTRFFKVRIGKKDQGRMIVFVVTSSNKVIPILIRQKKDKLFGVNMSINNNEVVNQLNKNLDHVLADIEDGKYEKFDI